jgi:hypothetical protein
MRNVELVLIWLAAPAVTMTALLYTAVAVRRRSLFGWAFLAQGWALSLLLDLSLLFYYRPTLASEHVALGVYVLIWVSSWLMLAVTVATQFGRRR